LQGAACLVDGGRRVGTFLWISGPVSPFERGSDSSGGAEEKGTAGCRFAAYQGMKSIGSRSSSIALSSRSRAIRESGSGHIGQRFRD